MDSIGSKLYAGKRRRRPAKRNTLPTNGTVRTNPSKRHRDRLNAELDRLASLLPFDSETVSKLDKLSILRLSVSYLRNKSYFQGTRDKDLFQTSSASSGNRFLPCAAVSPILNSSLVVTDGNGQNEDDVLLLEEEAQMYMQALNGFIIVIQSDGQIFYASPSVQEYLGFQDADIMHQNVFELIHKEDRDDFQKQLLLCPPTSTCSQEVAQRVNGSSDEPGVPPDVNEVEPTLDRSFTSRLRCLLDESSGFLSLQFAGRLRMLHGQRTRGKDGIPVDVEPPEMALFALASPLQQPSIMEIYVRNMIFRTKHKLDFKTVNIDAKGSEVLGYSETEFRSLPGYQYIHYEDIIYCSEMHSSLIRKGETGFIYFRLMSKQMKWVWVQAKGRVMYKNGKPDYLVSTHRPMGDEEGEQHLMNRRKPFRWPFAGKAELYECNPPYPPIPPVILQALQRGEMPSFGEGPSPGVSMGDMPPGMAGMPPGMPPGMGGMPPGMPPGMNGMPPGMPPGMNGMPPGMPPGMNGMPPGMGAMPSGMPPGIGGMPPGMGGMPPGMGDFPPGDMPPFGAPTPFQDDGPPPFGMNKDSMFSPRPDRGGTPSFDPTNTRFKSSPGYSPPTYPCDGNGSNANGGVNDWQEMTRNRSFLENGIKGHISPQESMPSMEMEASRTEFSRNLNDGSMSFLTETQSWTMNNMPSNQMRQQRLQQQDQHLEHLTDHAVKTSNMCSPRSTGSNDSGFSSGQNNGAGGNTASRKIAVVSPCQASPGRQLPQRIQRDARAPALSTGSLDSGVDNLPFENGDDIPTFDEALSLSTFDLEQQGALAETLLLGRGMSAANSWVTDNNGQSNNSQNQEFHNMPNQIGPKVESNTMHFNQNSNVLRSLLSNHQTRVSCKQEVPNASLPITSATHPNTVEWRSAASKATATSQNSVQGLTRRQPVPSQSQSKKPLLQGSVPPQQLQHDVRSSQTSLSQQQIQQSQQPNQQTQRIQQTTAGMQHYRQQPPVQSVSQTPNLYNSSGHLQESDQNMAPIQSHPQQPDQQAMQEQRKQLQKLHIHQQQQHQLQQRQQSLQPSRLQNGTHHMAKSADVSSNHQQADAQQLRQDHLLVQQQFTQQFNQQQQQHMQPQHVHQHEQQRQQIEQHHQMHQQQSMQAQRQQNLVQQHSVRSDTNPLLGLQKDQLHQQPPQLQQQQQQLQQPPQLQQQMHQHQQKQLQQEQLQNQQQRLQQKQQRQLYEQQLQQQQLQDQFDQQQQQLRLQQQRQQQSQQQQQHGQQQNFGQQMTNFQGMNNHMETKHSHFISSHDNTTLDTRGYLEGQMMMLNGGDGVGLHVNQDLPLSGKQLRPSMQPDLTTSDLMPPDLTSELLSSMVHGMANQEGVDNQGLYELPTKGLGSGHLIQNGFQAALTPSTNM